MWISKEEYESLKAKAEKLEDAKIEFLSEINIQKEIALLEKKRRFNVSDELYKIKKDLEYYLDTNEESGVVYIPKFVIKKIVYDT